MLSHIENFQKLSELELVREVNAQLDRAKEKMRGEGAEHGFSVCVGRMLSSGAHPEFIAKIVDVDLEFVLEVENNYKES